MNRVIARLCVAGLLTAVPAVAQEVGEVVAPDADGSSAALTGATLGDSLDPSGRVAAPGVTIERLDLTATPLVEARVTIVDDRGGWVHGLRADEFDVRLDDQPVELGTERAGITSRFVDGEHMSVLTVVDVSGSMRAALPHVRAAIADFAARLGEKDEIGLVTVADATRIPIPPGADRERLVALLDSLPIGGNTAILDAVVAGLDSLATRPTPRRALILLSDGADNRSTATVEEAAAGAGDHGIPIYGIALGDEADTAAMGALARASGGRLLREGDPTELRRIYTELAGLLQSEYRLTIRLTEEEANRWHRLGISLRSPPAGVPESLAATERPFLASRTPGVDRGFVSGARTAHQRGRLLWWWALGSLAALVPALGLTLAASRSERVRIRPLSVALALTLAGALGGLGALLWYALVS